MSSNYAIIEWVNEKLICIAAEWILNPACKAFFINNGVNWRKWPYGEARLLVQQYELGSEDERHVATMHAANFCQSPKYQETELDPIKFRGLYFDRLNEASALDLSKRIASTPRRAKEMIDEYIVDQAQIYEMDNSYNTALNAQESVLRGFLDEDPYLVCPGFEKLSQAIAGFQPGRIMLLAAATGVGKTTLALNLAYRLAEKSSVLFFNMEMMPDDFGARLLTVMSGIDSKEFNEGKANSKLVEESLEKLKKLNFKNSRGEAISLEVIEAKLQLERLSTTKPIIAIIDYDQKLTALGKMEEWQFLNYAIQKIEEIAKRLKCFVILLSQADEQGDPRASKRMKQSASSVIYFSYTEFKYSLEFKKNRFGPLDKNLILNYNPASGKITEVDFESKYRPARNAKRSYTNVQGVDD
jgi:predicted ATP-dependent serine protease